LLTVPVAERWASEFVVRSRYDTRELDREPAILAATRVVIPIGPGKPDEAGVMWARAVTTAQQNGMLPASDISGIHLPSAPNPVPGDAAVNDVPATSRATDQYVSFS
jgi:hypothetical protein